MELFPGVDVPPTIVLKDDWERNLILTALILSKHVHNGVVLRWFPAVPFAHGLSSPSREFIRERNGVTSIRNRELFQFSGGLLNRQKASSIVCVGLGCRSLKPRAARHLA
jgi:hypothetical protein